MNWSPAQPPRSLQRLPASVSCWLNRSPCGLPAEASSCRERKPMFRRPSVCEKLAHGKNLSPRPLLLPKNAKPQFPAVVVGLTVERPWIWAMFESTFAQTTANACVPTPPTLGLPARLGKLLQRNAEPPPFRAHDPVNGLPISLMFVMVMSEPGQVAPPSGENSSRSFGTPPVRSYQATINSPAASKAGLDPLAVWPLKLIDELPKCHDRPPSSVN